MKSINLGRFVYKKPLIILAPMAGISDLPFRRLYQEFGADFTTAEMVSAKPDLLKTSESQKRLLFDDHNSFPKIVQLLGSDPELMATAAQLMEAKGADIIDINLGCPAKIVAKQLAGSALLSDLKLLEKMVVRVVNAVKVPITLKTRLGYSKNVKTLHDVGKIAEDCGISLISVHGRTRDQRFTGSVNYEEIADFASNTKLPIIANGDITSAQQALELIKNYPFSGIMIGRAAQGNPQIFAYCQNLINGQSIATTLTREKIANHMRDLFAIYGRQGTLMARKHLHCYLCHLDNYPREKINHAMTLEQQLNLLKEIEL